MTDLAYFVSRGIVQLRYDFGVNPDQVEAGPSAVTPACFDKMLHPGCCEFAGMLEKICNKKAHPPG